jgi:FkbM family methyltransferase
METETMEIKGLKITYALGKKEEYIINEVIKGETYAKKNMVYLEDDVWLDAGAHIGCFSLWAADKVKHIYAYEPAQESFDLLVHNLKQNNITNVTPIRAAIRHDDAKTTSFFIGASSMGYKMKPTRGREEVTVPAENINDILEKYPDINALKIDIEGAEYDVFKAMEDKRWDKIRKFWCEWHFMMLKDTDRKLYDEMILKFRSMFDIQNYRVDTKKYWMDTFNFMKSKDLPANEQ